MPIADIRPERDYNHSFQRATGNRLRATGNRD
jgi:hypothetical protein